MWTPQVTLSLPWIPTEVASLGGLTIQRGPQDVLDYRDGITLQVQLVDPSMFQDVDELQDAVRSMEGPGRVTLVAGAVPIAWRADLRTNGVSFLDVSGTAEISWPLVAVSAGRFAVTGQRRRTPVPLQKGHALVAQEVLVATRGGARPTIGAIARGASADLSTASRTIAQLARQGWVTRSRAGHRVFVSVADPVALASRLAERTNWPGPQTAYGYLFGRNPWDIAARLAARAVRADVQLAVTGRIGAGFLGVTGTTAPQQVCCWVAANTTDLSSVAMLLGLEPVPLDQANVALSADRWRFGLHRASPRTLDRWTATVAHPLRVWCDLHDEPRGPELAAQLWGRIVLGVSDYVPRT